MKNLTFFLFVLALLSFSCSNQSNPFLSNSTGKIVLKIDRNNAPSNVVFVNATLTRDGYSPIISTLNLLSDSTADLLLDNIPAGLWHLKVDAMNDSMVVLYTGETDVNILAGFTTQISLTLQPTGQGTGSVHIYVTWGTNQTNFNWIDNPTNPILMGGNNSFDYYGIGQPVIIYDEGKYKMWYYGDGGSAKKYVLYAESLDGINWTKHPTPVLYPGLQGSWDSWAVQPAAVIKENGIYKMYYTGYADQYSAWSVGYATSIDGLVWTKRSLPVLFGTNNWEYQITCGSVIKKDNKYYLYYTGRNFPLHSIGLAISEDGITFTKYHSNPILTNDKSWELNGVKLPSVIKEGNIYRMVYQDAINNAFGFAYSYDGINWTKDSNNPFFRKEQSTNGWASNNLAYPFFISVNNYQRIYYAGASNSSNPFYKIGFLKKLN